MPLPSDERIVKLANDLLAAFDAIFGLQPGFRPAHAKGVLLTGSFAPSSEAATLTRAPHVNRPSVPVTVRFSDSTGIPLIPDNDPKANPRGMAIRFHLAERVHTDIISHSADGFPVRTGQEFLEFLRAVAENNPPKPSPNPVEKFLGTHPTALAFVQRPSPMTASFAREAYFGVTAFRFINKDGVARYGRYRMTPEAGVEYLDDAAAKAKGEDFLLEELKYRISGGPVRFKINVQVAAEQDTVDDATVHWPEDRALIPFGTLALEALVPDDAAQQKHLIYDPIPRVDGIEPSDDPLLELRAAVYLLSGRRRRQA
jgi:catalase